LRTKLAVHTDFVQNNSPDKMRQFMAKKDRKAWHRGTRIIHDNLALIPGTRRGVYEVTAQIGEGCHPSLADRARLMRSVRHASGLVQSP
jgi:hypothetical protein